MKQLSVLLVFALLIAMIGCSSNDPVTNTMTDDEAIQSLMSVDSVSEFSVSDEATIDDQDAQDWEVSGYSKTLVGIKVFRWGRKVEHVTRNISVEREDTVAVALITKIISGKLIIAASYSMDSTHADTVIRKPFTERVQRRVLFKRVARSDHPERNWKPVAMTLVKGGIVPDSLNKFDISSLVLTTSVDTYTVTNPLATWLYLGTIRNRVPVVGNNEEVTLRVTIMSTSDSAEAAVVRWAGEERHRRSRMTLVSSTAVSGGFERVYEKAIRAHLPPGRFVSRNNVVVDIVSHGTLHDDSESVSNRFWGLPYDVRRH